MDGECFFQSFCQTPRGTRVEMHQFVLQPIQRLFSSRIIFQRIRPIQFSGHSRLLFVSQVIQHIASLQSRAPARRPQERGFRLPASFRTAPVSQSAP